VRDCRDAWASLGRAHYDLLGSEAGNIQFRRSLYIVADVAEGELLTRDHVRSVRPGNGLAPDAINAVLGRPAARALRRGEPLGLEMLASPNSGIPVR
jgi:N-acetylneuraminate synthase